MAPGARERQTGSRWQSGAAGLRAKLQQRASATMPKFRVLLNPDTDNDFFSLLTLALHVCSFHLDSVFSVTYACDRGGSRGGVTGQGDRHLHTHGTLGTLGTHGTHRTHGTHTRESGAGWCVSHMGVTHTQIPVTVTQPQQHLNPHTYPLKFPSCPCQGFSV